MHDHQTSAYGGWDLVIAMVPIVVFIVVRFIPMRTRSGKPSEARWSLPLLPCLQKYIASR